MLVENWFLILGSLLIGLVVLIGVDSWLRKRSRQIASDFREKSILCAVCLAIIVVIATPLVIGGAPWIVNFASGVGIVAVAFMMYSIITD